MAYNPYSRYTQQTVMTMTHGEMLTKLYEGAILNMNLAVKAIGEKDLTAATPALQKAKRIFNYLIATLDRQYPISDNLAALYNFFNRQLIDAHVKMETKPILDVIPMVEQLRDTFIAADKLSRQGNAAAAQAQTSVPTRLAVSG